MKQIDGQISVFDILFKESFNPLKALTKCAGVYYKTSRRIIINAVCNNEPVQKLTKIIKDQYCPYGHVGEYRHNYRPNQIDEFTFTNSKIYIMWTGADQKSHEQYFSYQEFAKEIQNQVRIGDYK